MVRKDCSGLRLLIVGPYPPPFGGVASHLVTLIPGLRARGADDIAVVSFGDRDAVEEIDGATLYRINARARASSLASPSKWPSLADAVMALAPARFDVRRILAEATRASIIDGIVRTHDSNVVSFYQSDLSLALLPCARRWGKRRGIVLTVFGECYDNPWFFAGRKQFTRRFLDAAASVVSSSKHCATSFAQVGVTRTIEVVYYGIDLERFERPDLRESYRAELQVAHDETLILYMGRFSEEMGVGRVLEAGDALLARLPKVRLLLAGAKGPLSTAATAFATRFPGRVNVLHDVPFSVQPSLYAGCDIVLAPSHDQHACMGMSIKEAMAASRPVIGTRAGGIPEAILHERTGLLVPLDEARHIDRDGLLESIELLCHDAELRVRLGAAARKRAEELFSMDRTIDRMAEIFCSART